MVLNLAGPVKQLDQSQGLDMPLYKNLPLLVYFSCNQTQQIRISFHVPYLISTVCKYFCKIRILAGTLCSKIGQIRPYKLSMSRARSILL